MKLAYWCLILLLAITGFPLSAYSIPIVGVVGYIPSPGGSSDQGLAWDGEFLWSADGPSGALFQVDITTGNYRDPIQSPGYQAMGLAWDGQAFWISSERKPGSEKGRIVRFDAMTSTFLFEINSPGTEPRGVAWDGQFLWNVDMGTKIIYKLNPTTGAIISQISSPDSKPHGLAWGEGLLWITGEATRQIFALNPLTGEIINSFNSPGPEPHGLTWDGQFLWVSEPLQDKIYRLDVTPISYQKRQRVKKTPVTRKSNTLTITWGEVKTTLSRIRPTRRKQ